MINVILNMQKIISTGQMFKHPFMQTAEEENGRAAGKYPDSMY